MSGPQSHRIRGKILGIECAIAGGSLSVYSHGAELGSWIGEQGVHNGGELLPHVHRLLKQNSIESGEPGTIIVSLGPGSYTGIRVGLATVLGLRASLGIPCLGMTALQAISRLHIGDQPVITAVPMGRDLVCVQTFLDGAAASEPRALSNGQLRELVLSTGFAVVAHADVYSAISDLKHDISIADAGRNIASYLCAGAGSDLATIDLSPLFVERNSV